MWLRPKSLLKACLQLKHICLPRILFILQDAQKCYQKVVRKRKCPPYPILESITGSLLCSTSLTSGEDYRSDIGKSWETWDVHLRNKNIIHSLVIRGNIKWRKSYYDKIYLYIFYGVFISIKILFLESTLFDFFYK